MPIWLPLAIVSGITTGLNLLASKQNQKVAKLNTNLTIAEQKKQAELAFSREQTSILEMNKYNSPSSQMDRFTQAGLNKNLIYSQGTPGNQTQIAKYNAPNIEYKYKPAINAGDFDSLNGIVMQYYQIEQLAASGQLTKAKAAIETSLAKYADLLARGKAHLSLNAQHKAEFEKLFRTEELTYWFYPEQGQWLLKPEKAESFIESFASKILAPSTNLKKSQADLQIKEQLLKNLSVIPWLQPLISFLKLLK